MISNKEGWPKRMKLSDTVKIAIIAGIVTLGQAYIATRVIKIDNKVQEVRTKVDTVHQQINSRMDQLLEVSEKASKAEGKAEEKAETDAKPQDKK